MVPTCLYFEQKIPEGQTIRQKLNIRTENEFRNEYRNEYRNFGIRFCFVSGPETYFGFGFIIVSLRQKSLVILLFRYSHYTEISLSHSFRCSTFRSFPNYYRAQQNQISAQSCTKLLFVDRQFAWQEMDIPI